MDGTFDFDSATIKKTVNRTKKPGNFAIGNVNPKTNGFRPEYVGRSDNDLQVEILAKVKEFSQKYNKFMARYANDAKEAFEKECKNYHEFVPKENTNHPDKPNGTNLKCPFPKYHKSP